MKYRSSKRSKACAISRETKQEVYERDNGRCVFCGQPGLPEAHFIPRSKGGLGIPQNIVTMCRFHHSCYDFGTREEREYRREKLRKYLQSKYPGWDESKLIYHKYKEENNGQSET